MLRLSGDRALLRVLRLYHSAQVGLIWVGIDLRKQGWHDKLANTVVIRSRNRGPQPVHFER